MTRYKLEPSISLLAQKQPSRLFRASVNVLLRFFRLSARCIPFVQLDLIYSTQISLCQSVYRTVYAVDEWGIGVRFPTGAAVVTLRKPSGTGWDTACNPTVTGGPLLADKAVEA